MDPRGPGTVKMAARLERFAQQANPMANLFLSRERVVALRAALAADPKLASSQAMQFKLGSALLNAGQNEAALGVFAHIELISRATLTSQDEINLRLNQALCHLRMAELRNCLSNHNADSCLLPIQGGGIHLWPDESRLAIGVLTNLLVSHPDNLAARWLLNVAAMTVGDYPAQVDPRWRIPPQVFKSDYDEKSDFDIKRFIDVAGPAGLAVNELSGASVVEDFDGDGLLDIMVTSIGLRDPMHFYRNNGDGTFSDRAREAGLTGLTGGLNAIAADYNNDGFVDLFILRSAWMKEEGKFPNSLLKNNGDGTFEDVTEAAGLLSFHPTQTAVWFDLTAMAGWTFSSATRRCPVAGPILASCIVTTAMALLPKWRSPRAWACARS